MFDKSKSEVIHLIDRIAEQLEIDADVIYATVRESVPELLNIINIIKKDIEAE